MVRSGSRADFGGGAIVVGADAFSIACPRQPFGQSGAAELILGQTIWTRTHPDGAL